MSHTQALTYHTVDDEWLAAYSAGGLSVAKRLLLACQAAINPALAERLQDMDNVGGTLLETSRGESVSSGFIPGLFDRLDNLELFADEGDVEIAPGKKDSRSWMPGPLANFLQRADLPGKWSNPGFGMQRMALGTFGNEKLYLLKSKPGLKMPHHSHKGEEWALILQGGYHVGDTGFAYGDLHREDEHCAHQPIVDDDGEACITLVASEGGLKFTNPVLNLFRPVLGV